MALLIILACNKPADKVNIDGTDVTDNFIASYAGAYQSLDKEHLIQLNSDHSFGEKKKVNLPLPPQLADQVKNSQDYSINCSFNITGRIESIRKIEGRPVSSVHYKNSNVTIGGIISPPIQYYFVFDGNHVDVDLAELTYWDGKTRGLDSRFNGQQLVDACQSGIQSSLQDEIVPFSEITGGYIYTIPSNKIDKVHFLAKMNFPKIELPSQMAGRFIENSKTFDKLNFFGKLAVRPNGLNVTNQALFLSFQRGPAIDGSLQIQGFFSGSQYDVAKDELDLHISHFQSQILGDASDDVNKLLSDALTKLKDKSVLINIPVGLTSTTGTRVIFSETL